MRLLKNQHVLLFSLKSSHMESGNNIPNLAPHCPSSSVKWSKGAMVPLLFTFLHWETVRREEVCNMCQSLNLPQAVILEGGFSPAFMEGFSRNQ